MTEIVIVLTTVPVGEAGDDIAHALVEEHLAACVNLLAPMTSIYRWKENVERDVERQLVIKTTRARVPALHARIAQLHSYELPEFIVLAVADGGEKYLEWVKEQVL